MYQGWSQTLVAVLVHRHQGPIYQLSPPKEAILRIEGIATVEEAEVMLLGHTCLLSDP